MYFFSVKLLFPFSLQNHSQPFIFITDNRSFISHHQKIFTFFPHIPIFYLPTTCLLDLPIEYYHRTPNYSIPFYQISFRIFVKYCKKEKFVLYLFDSGSVQISLSTKHPTCDQGRESQYYYQQQLNHLSLFSLTHWSPW